MVLVKCVGLLLLLLTLCACNTGDIEGAGGTI